MAILTNKPAVIDANTSASITLNKSELATAIGALTSDSYWLDNTTWKAVTFLYKNVEGQKFPLSFNIFANSPANLTVPSLVRNGTLLCERIDISGFGNDAFSVLRIDFPTIGVNTTDFDIIAQNGYNPNPPPPVTSLALYHFDGNANDVYGHNLTVHGSPSYVTGRFNLGITGFNNINYLNADGSFFNVGTGDFTIECWAKFTTPIGGYENIVGINNPGYFTCVITRYNGLMRTWINDSLIASYNAPNEDSNFYHLVMQRKTGNVTCFINGVLQASATNTTSIPTTTEVRIGYDSNNGPSSAFSGVIDEVRISNAAMYNESGFTPPSSPLT